MTLAEMWSRRLLIVSIYGLGQVAPTRANNCLDTFPAGTQRASQLGGFLFLSVFLSLARTSEQKWKYHAGASKFWQILWLDLLWQSILVNMVIPLASTYELGATPKSAVWCHLINGQLESGLFSVFCSAFVPSWTNPKGNWSLAAPPVLNSGIWKAGSRDKDYSDGWF